MVTSLISNWLTIQVNVDSYELQDEIVTSVCYYNFKNINVVGYG